ncbi:hypothetical protein EDB92DRAFT_1818580 [Lactarius akahatsu]|uniref:Uncharacterized protein n=1 Tax=Lactarius akahatsu TaxID=416441 RepID=A0AAD4LBJ8_9AGAM|nr:hypothetical protein EDB92DRAFT_1818580 [Lactarius akahatsu]
MVLSFIYGPATKTWKHGIRQTLHPELSIDIESLWDEFLDSFCEIWVHYTESTVPTVAPVTQTSIEDLLITLAAKELLPHHASGTIDLTMDKDTDDWSPFTPHIPISPPSLVSILTQIAPIDELPLQPSPKIDNRSNNKSKTPTVSPLPPRMDKLPADTSPPQLPLVTANILYNPVVDETLPAEHRTFEHLTVISTSKHIEDVPTRLALIPTDSLQYSHAFAKRKYTLTRRSILSPKECIFHSPGPLIHPFDDSNGLLNSLPDLVRLARLAKSLRLLPESSTVADPFHDDLMRRNDSIHLEGPSQQSFSKAHDFASSRAFMPLTSLTVPLPSPPPSRSTVCSIPVALLGQSDVPMGHPSLSCTSDLIRTQRLGTAIFVSSPAPSLILILQSSQMLASTPVPQLSAFPSCGVVLLSADLLGSISVSIQTLDLHPSTALPSSPHSLIPLCSGHPSLVPSPNSSPLLDAASQPPLVALEDNTSKRGVKISHTSVFDHQNAPKGHKGRRRQLDALRTSPNPVPEITVPIKEAYYPSLFLSHAFEQPQDPDNSERNTTHTTPYPSNHAQARQSRATKRAHAARDDAHQQTEVKDSEINTAQTNHSAANGR